MAKLQGSITPPSQFDYSTSDFVTESRRHEAEVDEWLKQTAEAYRKLSKGDLVGELIKFLVGDGFAMYMVVKQRPLTLVHINEGDGWQALSATIRGTTLADVRLQVKRNKFLAKRG
jgi:hypothetical protein